MSDATTSPPRPDSRSARRAAMRLARYVRPHARLVVYATIALVLVSAANLATPKLVKLAVDGPFESWRLQQIGRPEFLDRVGELVLIFAAIIAGRFLFQGSQMVAMNLAGERTMRDLRMAVFRHLQSLDLKFFDRHPVGTLVTRVTGDVSSLNELLTAGVDALFSDLLQLLGIVALLLWLDVELALATFAVLPLMLAFTHVFRTRARAAFLLVRDKVAALNAYLQEMITGVRVTQLFHQEDKAVAGFDARNEELRAAHVKTVVNFAMFFPAIDFCTKLATAILLAYGAHQIVGGELTKGELVEFWMYVQLFFEPIRGLSDRYNQLQQAGAASERLFRLLDTKPAVPDPEPAVARRIDGAIELQDVWFRYVPEAKAKEDDWVLRGIDLKVAPGEKVALVGPTGAGKTSILSLVSRLYDVQRGAVKIDGVDVRHWSKRALRRQIAVVLQDVFLFSGSVARNIRLGDPTIDDARLREALATVRADRFVERLPRGSATEVQERGITLSGGQRQLLAFARALAFDPRILVLDEATSAVDTETERLIQDALDHLLEGRTALIVAHRLSTVQKADRIVVMHHGEIREMGTHQELLRERGIYYRLYQLQYR